MNKIFLALSLFCFGCESAPTAPLSEAGSDATADVVSEPVAEVADAGADVVVDAAIGSVKVDGATTAFNLTDRYYSDSRLKVCVERIACEE